jgi:hypothetical protein
MRRISSEGERRGSSFTTQACPLVLARHQVQAALVEVLTPICVDKFNRAENAQARLVEFKKMTSAWDRERFVRDNDFAKFGKESNSRVVDACASALYKL